jgi:hypothetical protein
MIIINGYWFEVIVKIALDEIYPLIMKIVDPKITTDGTGSTLAGEIRGYADGTGTKASFNLMYGMAADASGNLHFTDTENNCIRKIAPAGVSTLAGSGTESAGNADGPGADARFNFPIGAAAIDSAGNIYIADVGNYKVRLITVNLKSS